MGRPRSDPDRPATRDRLLVAAAAVFADDGFDRARLSDIASRAGIRRSSLLYHFASKADLYAAVVAHAFEGITVALTEGMGQPGAFPDRVEGMVRRFAGYLATHPHAARLVVREMLAPEGPGQAVIVEQVGPVLHLVVDFLQVHGGAHVRLDVPLGAAVLHVASDVLLQSAARGPLRAALWGEISPDRSWALARSLLLREDA